MKQHAFRLHTFITLTADALLISTAPVYGQAEKAAPNSTPTAEAVIAKYVDAVGGWPALEKITNRYVKGRVSVSGITLDMTAYTARPDKVYTLVKSAAIGDTEKGYDGEIAWEKSTAMGARILEGTELADAKLEAAIDQFADWRQYFEKAELTGSDTTRGTMCYTVVVTPKTGKPQTWYFDQKTGLVLRISTTIEHQMGAIPVNAYFEDHRTVDGILVPFRMTQNVMGQEMTITIDSMAQNIQLPPDIFKVPDDVKALIKK
jgi:hypothetical protein